MESYIVKVRVASPSALEALLAQIRATAGLSTRTTVVLSTPYENRPVTPPHRVGRRDDGAADGDGERSMTERRAWP